MFYQGLLVAFHSSISLEFPLPLFVIYSYPPIPRITNVATRSPDSLAQQVVHEAVSHFLSAIQNLALRRVIYLVTRFHREPKLRALKAYSCTSFGLMNYDL